MSATKVTPYFFPSEALEEPVCEVIALAMSPASAFVMVSVTSSVGASVVATGDCFGSVPATGDCVVSFAATGDRVGSGEREEGEQTTGSFLQAQHASRP
jgi:hypothetical protein